jgi:hypothetical protein
MEGPVGAGEGRRSHGRRHRAPNRALPLHAPRCAPRCRWRKKSTRWSCSPPPWTQGGKVESPRQEREGAGQEHDGSAPPPAVRAPRRTLCTPATGRSPEPPPTRRAHPSVCCRAPPRELWSPWPYSSVSRPARRGWSAREGEEVGAEEGEGRARAPRPPLRCRRVGRKGWVVDLRPGSSSSASARPHREEAPLPLRQPDPALLCSTPALPRRGP